MTHVCVSLTGSILMWVAWSTTSTTVPIDDGIPVVAPREYYFLKIILTIYHSSYIKNKTNIISISRSIVYKSFPVSPKCSFSNFYSSATKTIDFNSRRSIQFTINCRLKLKIRVSRFYSNCMYPSDRRHPRRIFITSK